MTVDLSLHQLATFQLDSLWLGIDIARIREINRVGEITPVPDAPPSVRGVINLRGDVVTVMDLRTLLGLPNGKIGPHTRLFIVDAAEECIGLLVDRVADVAQVDPAEREPLPANLAGTTSRFFTGVYKIQSDLLVELDVEATLNSVQE